MTLCCRDNGCYLKNFYIYKHPIHGIDAVKVGFSWPAFFFGPVWLLAEKLSGFAVLWLGLLFALLLTGGLISLWLPETERTFVYTLMVVGGVGLWIVPAFKGNHWKAQALAARGYQSHDNIQAQTLTAAVVLSGNSSNLYRELNRLRT